MIELELTVVGSKTLPVSDRAEWDGDAAVERMRKLASSDGSGDKDKVNFESYKRGFLYRGDEVKDFGSYKLPFADEIDGKLTAVWGGIAAALGALKGARTPVDIPEADKEGCYNVLAVYYKQLEKEMPPLALTEPRKYFFAGPVTLEPDEHTIDIEILREGEWRHPQAPGGILKLTRERIETFKQNFDSKILGEDLPLDIDHVPAKTGAVGWLKKMWINTKDNLLHLWARLDITNPDTQEAVKEGSLKYFSPQIITDYEDPSTGKTYDIIRSGALTAWPYIKNMKPAICNFSELEVIERVVEKKTEKHKSAELLLSREVELAEARKAGKTVALGLIKATTKIQLQEQVILKLQAKTKIDRLADTGALSPYEAQKCREVALSEPHAVDLAVTLLDGRGPAVTLGQQSIITQRKSGKFDLNEAMKELDGIEDKGKRDLMLKLIDTKIENMRGEQ